MRSDMHGMELAVQEDDVCKTALVQYSAEDMLCTKGRPPRLDSACNVSNVIERRSQIVAQDSKFFKLDLCTELLSTYVRNG